MTMRWTLAVALLGTACSEGPTLGNEDVVVSTQDAVTPAQDVVSAQDAPAPQDAGAMPGRVVINEVRGAGEDWVELYNVGGATVDLSGYGLTDSDSADGTSARIATALRFPSGTTLGAGEYLLVVADLSMPGMGPQTVCLMSGGPMRCLHAGFGISASRGEAVHLLDPSDRVIERADYPADGDAGVPAGQTFARVPNGVGAFTRAMPTPGASNRAP